MRRLAALIVLMLLATPAAAQAPDLAPVVVAGAVSERPDAVTVTIYRDTQGGLALVTETRTIDVPAGVSRVEFRGVADLIVAQTAAIEGLEGRVMERNEDFDLLTPGSLAERSVGRRARLVRTNPSTGAETSTAVTVRAAPNGVVLEHDGVVEALGCSGGPERLVFDSVPPSLAAQPTLSAVLRSPTAGRRRVTLSYLAGGLAWDADYVATLNSDGRTLDLLGWLTIRNAGRTTFAETPAQVVAGDLSRDASTQPVQVYPVALAPGCWPINPGLTGIQPPVSDLSGEDGVGYGRRLSVAGTVAPMMAPPPAPPPPPPPVAERSQLGDYQLYTLPGRTTLAASQTKQVRFLIQSRVPFETIYVHEGGTGASVAPVLRLLNTAAGGLNVPLPRGDLVVTDPSPDGPGLVGVSVVRFDVATGLPFELRLGAPSPVRAEESSEPLIRSDKSTAVRRTVILTNRRTIASTAEVREIDGPYTLSDESQPHIQRDGRLVWAVTLPPGGRAEVSYTLAPRR